MKLIKNLMPLKSAEKIVFEKLSEYLDENKKVKEVDIVEALNRISAEDIKAPIDLPYFNKAAMDGYAVIAEDTFGASETNPIILNLADGDEITYGEAKKIFTGDKLPKNANAVVMKEFCNEVDDFVEVYKTVHPNENVSRIGEDVKKGDVVLKKGEIINPYHLNMLASLGIKKIKVYDLSFGIISTGDELINLDEIRDIEEDISKLDGKIINSNSYMLYGLVKNLGFNAKIYDIVKDDKEKLKKAIKTALSENDALLITGGTSVSERDITVETVRELGDVIVHGVNIRPGKPFGFGIINDKPVFMLSGYPVASAVQFELFIQRFFIERKKVTLPLKRNMASELGRVDFVRVKVDIEVEPIRITGSGVISSLIKSDGYILIPENVEGYEKGELVDVYLLK
ncbi:TPA: molybdopterin molybdotransferase MoeA [Methanocaldococcus jannaschii]|uniref:Putative molybdopterin biosynthesis protein MJ0666 n=2 Tax=Methanocaldococcus jannaschii TaxID=2190 RepID=Y666_METJA|nr:molybdopterin molybdotransferase MoeA [Methanocaldococcus jannaschii]Q58080.1 RecName: Full=Putative molybdopterin biosynthesis protein MJ0666 [Methanocaldococcus jannaschii DSM 2661]AAB98661.1 molybdenum cofactor biosynthesis protein (moeA) [Methanocaldococcus jannaschii DSM 2661]HII59883.1 molybdopterin molybdotransferase MoeA [Methanocaldococcus jannaschii]